MTDHNQRTRRTVLGTLAALVGAVFGIGTGAARTRSDTADTAPHQSKAAAKSRMAEVDERPRNGVYDGTIDRIVDDRHVVILLESDGETVGQYVVDPDRVPDGSEGDSVTVWLFRGAVLAIWVD